MYYRIARKFRGTKFLHVFHEFVPTCEKFNPQSYIYVIDNGNWIGICENKMMNT